VSAVRNGSLWDTPDVDRDTPSRNRPKSVTDSRSVRNALSDVSDTFQAPGSEHVTARDEDPRSTMGVVAGHVRAAQLDALNTCTALGGDRAGSSAWYELSGGHSGFHRRLPPCGVG